MTCGCRDGKVVTPWRLGEAFHGFSRVDISFSDLKLQVRRCVKMPSHPQKGTYVGSKPIFEPRKTTLKTFKCVGFLLASWAMLVLSESSRKVPMGQANASRDIQSGKGSRIRYTQNTHQCYW